MSVRKFNMVQLQSFYAYITGKIKYWLEAKA